MNVMTEQRRCQKLFETSSNIETVIRYLRKSGYHQIDCIKIVRSILNTDLAEAKKLVHFSETWSDARDATDILHNTIETGIKERRDIVVRKDNKGGRVCRDKPVWGRGWICLTKTN